MIRLFPVLVVIALSWGSYSASAQDFTTQDPRYTTTPSQYTTTPAQYTTTPSQYTTTPSQYTTTPPAYLPQTSVVTLPGGSTPTIPTTGTGGRNTTITTSQQPVTSVSIVTTPQSLSMQQLVQVVPVEQIEIVETPELVTPSEPLVEWFATFVLRLNENETQQMVSDYIALIAQLGLDPAELSGSTRLKIVLYLTLSRLLNISGNEIVTGTMG